eukprot:c34923_g1_i1 orf=66-296(+)
MGLITLNFLDNNGMPYSICPSSKADQGIKLLIYFQVPTFVCVKGAFVESGTPEAPHCDWLRHTWHAGSTTLQLAFH